VIVEPNPAVSNLLFHLNSNIGQRAAIRFFNKMGAMVVEKKMDLVAGENELHFDVSSLPPDIYW
jgi:hypothetical protein